MSDPTYLYLMRHGEALPESEDPAQPLSARGRAEAARMARHLGEIGVRAALVGHSGKLRARETAEILAERLLPPRGLHVLEGLAPMADPAEAAERAQKLYEPCLWVGHLPHLERLASRLLVGETSRPVLRFAPAAISCLARDESGWRLCWLLPPDALRRRL